MSKTASLSYLIPTLNRPAHLRRCLESIARQTILPHEVIVVDQSDDSESKTVFEAVSLGTVEKKYLRREEKGLTRARNAGLDLAAENEFAGFLDDDVVLDADYTRLLLGRFESPGGARYAAGMGTIHGSRFEKSLFKKVFLLPRDGDGKILPSGAPTFPRWMDRFAEVEFVSGGMSIYRSRLLRENGYDNRLLRYSYGDDVDVSYRLSRKHKLFYEPRAVVFHDETAPGRDPGAVYRRHMLQNMYYLMEKNMSMGLRNRLLFSWFAIGQTLDDLLNLRKSALVGDFLAVRNILAGDIDSVERYEEFLDSLRKKP